MDWSDEEHVRVYTRDTEEYIALSWQARAVWHELTRKFGPTGHLEMRRGRRGLAALIRLPQDVVESAVTELVAEGRLRELATGYFDPEFVAAQGATKSPKLRAREARERARSVTKRDATVANRDAGVTDCDGQSRAGPLRSVTKRDATVANRDAGVTDCDGIRDLAFRISPDLIRLPPELPDPRTIERAERDARPSLAVRQSVRAELWAELAMARATVAAELGLPIADHALMAFDPGEKALGARLAEARDMAELELIAGQARKAIAIITAEARAASPPTIQWITGAMFENDRVWRHALGKSLQDAARPRSAPRAAQPEPVLRRIRTLE